MPISTGLLHKTTPLVLLMSSCFAAAPPGAQTPTYPVVDTMQTRCFDTRGQDITCPVPGEALHGQDAQYQTQPASYTDNGNGTVTDQNTRLVWQKAAGQQRLQFAEARSYCAALELGGRTDWRVPTIKELYSLADFRGELLKPEQGQARPYIDTTVFDFQYPSPPMVFAGQYWSSTLYVKGPIINGANQGAFGFNFADGHIKAYGTGLDFFTGQEATDSGLPTPPGAPRGGQAPGNFVRCVSGAENVYGINQFKAEPNGTVIDTATQRQWQQKDDGQRREWKAALAYCEALNLGGHQDWRLPDSKELQSIVDYDKTGFPAIDTTVFGITQDAETLDFWTSTTQGDFKTHANVIAFGKALSKSASQAGYRDWHGAGAQRSSIKTLNGQALTEDNTCSINACDVNRPDNLVRCVRSVR